MHFEHKMRAKSQRLVDLKKKAAELERQLSDARVSLERELAQFAYSREEGAPRGTRETHRYALDDLGGGQDGDRESTLYTAPRYSHDHSGATSGPEMHSPEGRTEVLVNHGRSSAYYPGLSRRLKLAILAIVVAALVAILVVILSSGGASWPSSVAIVQSEVAKACQNPDVKSEPGQVNFACAKTTRQILWVFALMTSGDNPDYANAKTGRMGLEPITPVQGGEVAWSLNLHSPYNPFNPTDSIEVAARAINNIVGGATVTGADGNVVVQPGLESGPGNCVRYTGSAAIRSRKDFPSVCAEPVTSPAGQAALVADSYKRWMVGAAPQEAQDAAVLFTEAQNPGDPRVQAILKHLSRSRPAA
jgi:hypothetical protein